MFKAEWGYFKEHKFYIVVMIGLLVLPSIYAVVFLSSLWNPYQKVSDLPVVVVNKDKALTVNKQKMAVGKDLASELKKSDAMDFTVLNEKEANKGVADGKYYMKITIPKDFSKNATSLLEAKPKKMVLHYEISSGHSFIAGKMAETAAEGIVAQVAGEVTETYAKQMVKAVKKVGAGVNDAAKANKALADGSLELENGNKTITTNLGTLTEGATTFENGTKTLDEGVTQLSEGATALTGGVETYTSGVSQAYDGSKEVSDGLTQLNDKLGTAAVDQDLADVEATLADVRTKADELLAGMPTPEHLDDAKQVIAKIKAQKKILAEAQKHDQQELTKLINGLNELDDSQKQLVLQTIEQQQSNSAMTQKLTALQTDFDNLESKLQPVLDKAQEKLDSATQLHDKIQTVAENDLANGIGQLREASAAITELTDGSEQVTAGLGELNQNSATLLSGSQQLSGGLTTVKSNVPALIAGADQIRSGSSELADGSKTLGDGLVQVQGGNTTLAEKLGEVGKATSNFHATKALYNQVATPVKAVETEKDHVKNNGTGMTPYMLSVGLYVGMLAFNLMMGMGEPRKKPESELSWFASKMSVLGFYSVLAATIVYGLAVMVLGLDPIHPWATYGMTVMTSLTFGAIVTALNLWLDKPGAFLAVVFLVLQLSGSAGTYPIQLTSGFFKWLHPYLPMTYTVDGFRESIMIGGSVWPQVGVLLGITAVFTIIMYLYYAARMRNFTMMSDLEEL
ncbi:YhgE/Pip domain-containing protein [Weissella confusa]|uniref:YhgE/Pip domain-containing protein n=1 Tax=Weissella confusa TaxID=1583 RepID=A0A4Z0S8A5_WEICO|nr:YhgE/Pip domain-containing protein [Weissella confusa]TGE75835.1 YhgE/Pip domain-containing protein [Weissella confusa]